MLRPLLSRSHRALRPVVGMNHEAKEGWDQRRWVPLVASMAFAPAQQAATSLNEARSADADISGVRGLRMDRRSPKEVLGFSVPEEFLFNAVDMVTLLEKVLGQTNYTLRLLLDQGSNVRGWCGISAARDDLQRLCSGSTQ